MGMGGGGRIFPENRRGGGITLEKGVDSRGLGGRCGNRLGMQRFSVGSREEEVDVCFSRRDMDLQEGGRSVVQIFWAPRVLGVGPTGLRGRRPLASAASDSGDD